MYEKNLPTDGRISNSKKQTKNAGGSDGSSALFLSIDQGVFYNENSKQNYGGFTAIYHHSGGKLRRLHDKANTARKYNFGGAV